MRGVADLRRRWRRFRPRGARRGRVRRRHAVRRAPHRTAASRRSPGHGDAHGDVVHVFERECSVQRRHQKVVEESPSPAIDAGAPGTDHRGGVRAARAAPIEMPARSSSSSICRVGRRAAPFYFLEMNTRLQVEHPVTEATAGVDLVRAQLLVASGEPLPWRPERHRAARPCDRGAGLRGGSRTRISSAGRPLAALPRAADARRARSIPASAEGSDVPVHYDPLLAKVIAWAETRDLAIARLSAALEQFVIDGVTTNIPFLRRILDHPSFRAGTVDTGFLDREGAPLVDARAVTSGRARQRSAPASSRTSTPTRHRVVLVGSLVRPSPGAALLRPPGSRRGRRRAGAASNGRRAVESRAPMPATVVKVLVKPGAAWQGRHGDRPRGDEDGVAAARRGRRHDQGGPLPRGRAGSGGHRPGRDGVVAGGPEGPRLAHVQCQVD